MPITINGNGTVTGISVGGLPDGIVDTDMIANNAVTSAKATGVGGPVKKVQFYSETATLAASSTNWTSGTNNSFTKLSSSSDSVLVYEWNGYLAHYQNSNSDMLYRVAYTPDSGSEAYLSFLEWESRVSGEARNCIPVCMKAVFTNLNAGTHTFKFQCKWDGNSNNNSEFKNDTGHHRIIITEIDI